MASTSKADRRISLPTYQTFAISSIAPALAVFFTNPFDTAKVRMQLQGERIRIDSSATANIPSKVYQNSFDCMARTYRIEGLSGLQKGLSPAILREASKNLFRLGLFDPTINLIHGDQRIVGLAPAWKLMCTGAFCGALGALSCNPFELVKTRLQSAAPGEIAVGYQHGYTGVWSGLRSIIRNEGIVGLFRGAGMSIVRSMVGSGANLSMYSLMKQYLINDCGIEDGPGVDMVSGLSSGFASVIAMNPIDVIRTRYYNQLIGPDGTPSLYRSGLACAQSVIAHEGPAALYKGFSSHFLRIGPHFCLSFTFLGILRRTLERTQSM